MNGQRKKQFVGGYTRKDLIDERALVLNTLMVTKRLTTLVDDGYNKYLYDQLSFPRIIATDYRDLPADPPIVIVKGNYEHHYLNYTQDNAVFMYFIMNILGPAESARRSVVAEQIKKKLIGSAMCNSYYLLWTRNEDSQSYQLFEMERGDEITL